MTYLECCFSFLEILLQNNVKKEEPQVVAQVSQPQMNASLSLSNNTQNTLQNNTLQNNNTLQSNRVQFKTSQEIPENYFTENATIQGSITKVIDGDTVKFYHTLNPSDPVPTKGYILKDQTLTIRIAGIDAPETDHGPGKPGMPFGKEAADFLSSQTENQQVDLVLLSKVCRLDLFIHDIIVF